MHLQFEDLIASILCLLYAPHTLADITIQTRAHICAHQMSLWYISVFSSK